MTALDQNFSDLANILMQRRQMQTQQTQQDRANRLSDLQYKQLQREDDYQTGLQGAMSNPGSTTRLAMQPEAQQTPQLSLASLVPGNQLQPPQFQPMPQPQASPVVQAYKDGRMQAQTTPRSKAQAGAEYAMSRGKIEDAAKLINMDDALAQYAAKVQAGQGDPATYYKQKQDMDTYKQFVTEVAPLLKTPEGLQFAQTIAKKYQQIDPGHSGEYDLSTIKVQGNAIAQQVKDPATGAIIGHMITVPGGSPHFQKVEEVKPQYKDRTRPEGTGTVFEESQDGGKTWAVKSRGAKGENSGGHGSIPKGGKPLPAGTLTDLNEASQMVKTLKEAQGLAAGVNTGPIMGRLQSGAQKLGLASGDFTQMKQKIATVNNSMLKLRSGAAVTESEYQRFLQEMPTPNDTETVRDTKFAAATKYMEDLLDGKIATFAEGGYKVPTGVVDRSKPAGKQTAQPTNKPIVTKGGFKVTRVP